MFPQDVQMLWDDEVIAWWSLYWDWDIPGTPDDPVGSGVVLCHPTTAPACFLARFTGIPTDPITGAPAVPLDITGSGRITETVHSADGDYEDVPVLIFEAPTGAAPQLLLAQELQSTGDDVFQTKLQTGLQAAKGDISQKKYAILAGDTHRLESIEPLVRRGPGVMPGDKVLEVTPVTSDILDVQSGVEGSPTAITGLDDISPVKAAVGATETARFIGFKLRGDNKNSIFRYLGAYLRGHRVT